MTTICNVCSLVALLLSLLTLNELLILARAGRISKYQRQEIGFFRKRLPFKHPPTPAPSPLIAVYSLFMFVLQTEYSALLVCFLPTISSWSFCVAYRSFVVGTAFVDAYTLVGPFCLVVLR